VTNFCSKKKNGKKYFCAKTILENIFFRKKKCFGIFCPQKVSNFCSKKIN
jgi:hypothetical protein